MPAVRKVVKNWQMFADGRGYAGQCSEYTPPVLTVLTEDFRGGGMDAPEAIDMGMEGMEGSFVLNSYDRDMLSLFGMVDGGNVALSWRGASQDADGTVEAIEHSIRAKITVVDQGSFTAGEMQSTTFTYKAHYYRLRIDGRVVHEVDVRNMVRIINGEDQVANQRRAIGL